jgi:hypothetical protein
MLELHSAYLGKLIPDGLELIGCQDRESRWDGWLVHR